MKHSLENKSKRPDYKKIVNDMFNNFRKMGCNISLKLHYLHSYIDFFPENHSAKSEQKGERESHYCWMLKKNEPNTKHNREILKRFFEGCRSYM